MLMVVNPPHKSIAYTRFTRKAQISKVLRKNLTSRIEHEVPIFSDLFEALDARQFACFADIGF